jgi:hypothetical protein
VPILCWIPCHLGHTRAAAGSPFVSEHFRPSCTVLQRLQASRGAAGRGGSWPRRAMPAAHIRGTARGGQQRLATEEARPGNLLFQHSTLLARSSDPPPLYVSAKKAPNSVCSGPTEEIVALRQSGRQPNLEDTPVACPHHPAPPTARENAWIPPRSTHEGPVAQAAAAAA